MKQNDILTFGLIGLGGYVLYKMSKGLEATGEAIGGTVEGVSTGVQGLGSGISDVGTGVGRVASSVGESVGSFFDIFDTLFDKAKAGAESIGERFSSEPEMNERMEAEFRGLRGMRIPLRIRTADNIQAQRQMEEVQQRVNQGYGAFDTVVLQSLGISGSDSVLSRSTPPPYLLFPQSGKPPANEGAVLSGPSSGALRSGVVTSKVQLLGGRPSTSSSSGSATDRRVSSSSRRTTSKYTPVSSKRSALRSPTRTTKASAPRSGYNPALRSSALKSRYRRR